MRKFLICGLVAVGCCASAVAATKSLTCGGAKSITSEAAKLAPGDTLQVSGTCIENVSIPANVQNIAIVGLAGARIQAPAGSTTSAVVIRGRTVRVSGFTITGGVEGVQVLDGGAASIDGNTIEANSGNAVLVQFTSLARIFNNIIQNNGDNGVLVSRGSSALIGLASLAATTPSPNTIVGNGGGGIQVSRSSHATVVGNTISGNASHGVLVNRGAQADVASNTIANNGDQGIEVAFNSAANLGNTTGTGLRDLPNSGSGNAGFGLRCFGAGSVGGRIGTLTGNAGALNPQDCAGVVSP
jgi:parallel beta-helix repeat protein